MEKVALVTGSYRGIGLEVCRQLSQKGFTVLLSARTIEKATEGANALGGEKAKIIPLALDVSKKESVLKAAAFVKQKYGHLNVLVNNAGIFIDERDETVLDTPEDTITKTFASNTLGPFLMCQAFYPLLLQSKAGRIVNVSSGMGQLSDMETKYPGYRISKTALNAVTKIFAAESAGKNILVNTMCPGWVRTEMGGSSADRTVEQGADTVVWLSTLPDDGPTGGFFRDREIIPW